jgi:hypothetical protein
VVLALYEPALFTVIAGKQRVCEQKKPMASLGRAL